MKAYHHLIKGPIITEKTHSMKEAGNKLTLKVDVKANKIEIRKAIEAIFKVKVLAVKHHADGGQKEAHGARRRGAPHWKKAIVTLAPGEKIAGYEL